MRRILAVILPSCLALLMAVPAAHAGTIERVETTAEGVVPATVIVTLNNPDTATGLVRVCITSRSAGQLACINI
jgi:hypothetical protein